MLRTVVGLLALHLAAGTLVVTEILTFFHRVPPGFVRFCAMVAALAALVSVADHPARWPLALVSTSWYIWALSATSTRATRWASVLSVVTALGVLIFGGAALPEARTALAFGSLTSAFLIGSTTVSMILGHWYLVDPTLSIAPLRLGALLFALSVAARWIVVALVLLDKGSAVLGVERAADLVYSTPALFFLFRALSGLVGPLLLAGLIWQTVRMRSTQSATGLLYVAVILVLFGELISQFLTVTARVPL